jgi:type IV pilus assembly protein PilC
VADSVFPRIVVSLMKASEASGTMALMLGRVGDYLSKERRTARQIKGALSYPVFMLLIGLGLSVFLMLVILPRFAKIYEGKGAALPTPTKILLGASEFMRDDYLMWGPPLVVVVVGGWLFARTNRGGSMVDWLRLHIPLLRTMYRQLYITRAARTMSTLLAAGVNLLDIIDICRSLTGNRHFNRVWNDMESGVRDGRQLSESILDSEYIPSNVASMIASGERSGRLAEVMERIADFADEELENAIKQVTSYIEPIMILVMGVVVGGVAMALLLPIFKIGNVVAGG